MCCLINSLGATQQQDSLELGVAKLECTVENLNLRLARLLGEVTIDVFHYCVTYPRVWKSFGSLNIL